MRKYGFIVNMEWKLPICMTCHSGINTNGMYEHLNKELKGLGLSVSREYCKAVKEEYGLLSRSSLKSPTSVILAIYGLPIKHDLYYCDKCGYAAHTKTTLVAHKKCGGYKILCGPAQTFFPTTGEKFFAVIDPLAKVTKPVDPTSIAARFKSQFTPAPSSDRLITIPSNNRDVSHFLSLGNWFQEVEGLTGREAYDITRNSLPNLRGLVRQSMNLYVDAMNKELLEEDFAVKVAMGDYNGCALSQTMGIACLFTSGSQGWVDYQPA
jgi:hypothetical protein